MNYSVHAFMYGYYFLMAADAKPKWLNPMWITVVQILQMVMGITVTVSSIVYSANSSTCHVVREMQVFQMVMYGSYLYLFAEFMVKRFVFKTKSKPKKFASHEGPSDSESLKKRQ